MSDVMTATGRGRDVSSSGVMSDFNVGGEGQARSISLTVSSLSKVKGHKRNVGDSKKTYAALRLRM